MLAAIREELAELTRYPDGNGFALKSLLADKCRVELNQVTLGNGSNDILELVGRAYLAPGLNAVFSEHAFAVYPIVTQAVGADARVIPARTGAMICRRCWRPLMSTPAWCLSPTRTTRPAPGLTSRH